MFELGGSPFVDRTDAAQQPVVGAGIRREW
jgi:hypothetical protein